MAVEIQGGERRYPHFKDGQVLTHNDLNVLRDFLYSKALFHGRTLIGFGVGCGLEGVISGARVEFSSGFGVGQDGLELVYPDAPAPDRTFELPAVALAGEAYPFIDPAQPGRTAILRPTETLAVAGGECGPEGCTTHTESHLQGAEIVWVQGRLRLSSLQDDPAFALQPVVPVTNPALTGFAGLRDALYTQLNGRVDDATRNLLKALTLSGPKGIDLLKVGIVNEVLYTLWDYLQCRQALTTPCMGESGAPAIALGYASGAGAAWTWDQRFRHYFRLSLALSRAIRGYRGQDVCARHLDHIRVLLEDFTPPVVPTKPEDVPKPEIKDVHICAGKRMRSGHCVDYRGEYRRPLDRYILIDPTRKFEPRPNPLDDPRPEEQDILIAIEHLSELDPLQVGTINSFPLLGFEGAEVGKLLIEQIKATNLTPDVHVVTETVFNAEPGLQPALVAAASDSIYISVNAAGAVTGLGIKPTAEALGQIGNVASNAGQALVKAGEALGEATRFAAFVETAGTSLGELRTGLSTLGVNLGTLREDLSREISLTRGSIPPTNLLVQAVALAEEYKDVQLDIKELKTKIDIRGGGGGGLGGGAVVGDKALEANQALKVTLDSMLTALETSATRAQLPRVRKVIAEVQPQLQQLNDAIASGMLLTAAQPEALVQVLDGVTRAVIAAGVAENSVEVANVRSGVMNLRHAVGLGGP